MIPWKSRSSLAFGLTQAILIGTVTTLIIIQVIKYKRGFTTYTERREKNSVLALPPISFCPGFKTDKSFVWDHRLDEEAVNVSAVSSAFPVTETGARQSWDESTFSVKEFIVSITLRNSHSSNFVYRPGGEKTDCIDVKERSTITGKCYTVSFPCEPGSRLVQTQIYLDLEGVARRKLFAYIHPRLDDAPFGLNNNYWLHPATGEVLPAEEVTELGLMKSVKRERSGSDTQEFYRCQKRLLLQLLDELDEKRFCMVPMFGAIFDFSGKNASSVFRPCETHESFRESYSSIEGVLNTLYWDEVTPCLQNAEEITYSATRKTMIMPVASKPDRATLHVFYDSTDVTITEEYVLMDAGALLSTVGGLVGVFLGWSLLDLARWMCSGFDGEKSR